MYPHVSPKNNRSEKVMIIEQCDQYKELKKLGFRPNIYIDNEHANELYHHMNKNNMIFLKKSYGTIVNEDFKNFFKLSDARRPYRELRENKYDYGIDHTNILYSKNYKVHILTSSPYHDVFGAKLNVPDCQVFLINPRFLDYYSFMGNANYGCNLAYVKDKYLDDFNNLKDEMKEYYGFNVFVKLGE